MSLRWIAAIALSATVAGEGVTPARLRSGGVPAQPPQAPGGGQVLLEARVSATGTLTEIVTLRSTSPFTALLRDAVRGWQFAPAEEEGKAVDWPVLVAGIFRPPTLLNVPTLGEPPKDTAQASDEVPFPTAMTPPLYPPRAFADGVVLIEVEVGEDGSAKGVKLLRGAAGFDKVAVEAARQWRFRPARRAGSATAAVAYLVFGFRQPVSSPIPR